MTIDPIQQEYEELWKEYGLLAIPKRTIQAASALSELVFVGEINEAKEEDLLGKIIEAMGYNRSQVPIVSLLNPSDIDKSLSMIKEQISIRKPKVVVALGSTATILLSGLDSDLSQMRGKWMKLHWDKKINLIATYPPSYLLINPSAKKTVWEDMKLAKKKLS